MRTIGRPAVDADKLLIHLMAEKERYQALFDTATERMHALQEQALRGEKPTGLTEAQHRVTGYRYADVTISQVILDLLAGKFNVDAEDSSNGD